jgi:hypothetical protein
MQIMDSPGCGADVQGNGCGKKYCGLPDTNIFSHFSVLCAVLCCVVKFKAVVLARTATAIGINLGMVSWEPDHCRLIHHRQCLERRKYYD